VGVVVVAAVRPETEHRDDVWGQLEKAAPQVHAEDGCELWALHEAKGAFVIIEQWRDGEALKAHGSGPVFTKLTRALEGKLEAPLDVQVLTPRSVGDSERGAVRPLRPE
jgi:quinol monooxygenase YgiN